MHRPLILILLCMVAVQYSAAQVKCGIDNLVDTEFEMFKGRRVALVTHAAARTLRGRTTADEFLRRRDLTVVRTMAPEHGYYGFIPAGERVPTDTLPDGTVVRSLYGELRRPTNDMLDDVDAVVIDLQDIGVRSYTYLSTMIEVMEACAAVDRPVYVLDRPNPLGGSLVDGSIVDDSLRSFVGRVPVPYVHGCTMGELATMANGLGWLGKDSTGKVRRCSLTVVKCKRWTRSMTWEQTGRTWHPTSPNIPSVHAIRGYAVTGLAGELSLMNIGIGTATPFTVIGAPSWPADDVLIQRLAASGVQLLPTRYIPPSGKHARMRCDGYHLAFDSTLRPFRAAMTLLHTIAERTPHMLSDTLSGTSRAKMFAKTSGHGALLDMLLRRVPWSEIEALTSRGTAEFRRSREPYLLYH